jgi:hypothetical protein
VDLFWGVVPESYLSFHHQHTARVFGNLLPRLRQNDIALGELYGRQGVYLDQLLTQEPIPDMIVEIPCGCVGQISRPKMRALLRDYTVIVHDFMEGGWALDNANVPAGCVTATGSLVGHHINMPIFALSVHANHVALGNLDLPHCHANQTRKMALALARKPRLNRLDFLHELDTQGLLDQVDWSLVLNRHEPGELGDFKLSPNVSTTRWHEQMNHDFVKNHGDKLPRTLDNISRLSECMYLPEQFRNKYNWYVSMETYDEYVLPTEKTFKGFLSGADVVTIAPPGFNQALVDLGFNMDTSYDHLEGIDRVQAVVQKIQSQPDWDRVLHNHALMCDTAFLEDLVIHALK